MEAHRDLLENPGLKTRFAEALQGSGIDRDAVLTRLREGAGNAALEQQWLAQDLWAIAKEKQLDLRDRAQRDQAMERLEAVHDKLGDMLTKALILRAVQEVEREGPEREAARKMVRFRAKPPQDHPIEGITGAKESPRQAYAEGRNLDVTAPQLASALRQAVDGKIELASDTARQHFIAQVNDRLTPSEIDDLHRGEARVLARITPNTLAQLQLARAYLEARDIRASDPAMDSVLQRIVEARQGAEPGHSLSDAGKGITHG